jgi:hypothetical protein
VDTRPLRHPAPDNFDGWAFYGIWSWSCTAKISSVSTSHVYEELDYIFLSADILLVTACSTLGGGGEFYETWSCFCLWKVCVALDFSPTRLMADVHCLQRDVVSAPFWEQRSWGGGE